MYIYGEPHKHTVNSINLRTIYAYVRLYTMCLTLVLLNLPTMTETP